MPAQSWQPNIVTSNGSSASFVVTKPSGTEPYIFLAVFRHDGVSITTPTNMTLAAALVGNGINLQIYQGLRSVLGSTITVTLGTSDAWSYFAGQFPYELQIESTRIGNPIADPVVLGTSVSTPVLGFVAGNNLNVGIDIVEYSGGQESDPNVDFEQSAENLTNDAQSNIDFVWNYWTSDSSGTFTLSGIGGGSAGLRFIYLLSAVIPRANPSTVTSNNWGVMWG